MKMYHIQKRKRRLKTMIILKKKKQVIMQLMVKIIMIHIIKIILNQKEMKMIMMKTMRNFSIQRKTI
jgi:hypothetical protein